MQFVLDHLLSVIIGGSIMLMLVVTQQRNQEFATETFNFYALRQQQLSFIEILQRDLQNVTKAVSLHEDASTMTFTFRARTDPADSTDHEVKYRRVFVDSYGEVNYYQVQRLVDGVEKGGSMQTLVSWQIEARNAEGVAVGAAENTRQIFVEFEADNPYRHAATIDRARWSSTFRPPLIQQNLNI